MSQGHEVNKIQVQMVLLVNHTQMLQSHPLSRVGAIFTSLERYNRLAQFLNHVNSTSLDSHNLPNGA